MTTLVIAVQAVDWSIQPILVGKVYRVADGDTMILLNHSGEKTVIRLDGIDAPENGQVGGHESAKKLQDLILGKEVKVIDGGNDKYRRTIGRIYIDKVWINLEMVGTGHAWHFKRYSQDEDLAKAETKARKQKLGLWAKENPVAPWDYRQTSKQRTSAAFNPPTEGETAVYVTQHGRSYHRADCRFVIHAPIEIGIGYAKGRYRPCQICQPPT